MIDGYTYEAKIEVVENGFIVSYTSPSYSHCQKVFTNIEDALAFVRECVYPKHVAERHPGLAGEG